MLERRADNHIVCWDDSNKIISEHEHIFKSQLRQIQSISQQVTGLEDKLLKKTWQMEEKREKGESKEKDYNRSREWKLKASETELEHKVKMV